MIRQESSGHYTRYCDHILYLYQQQDKSNLASVKNMGHRNISQVLDPAAMSQLLFVVGPKCTFPSFPKMLVLERWPGVWDRDEDITYSSSPCGEGTGLTASTQPGAQQGFAAEQSAFKMITLFLRVLVTAGELYSPYVAHNRPIGGL